MLTELGFDESDLQNLDESQKRKITGKYAKLKEAQFASAEQMLRGDQERIWRRQDGAKSELLGGDDEMADDMGHIIITDNIYGDEAVKRLASLGEDEPPQKASGGVTTVLADSRHATPQRSNSWLPWILAGALAGGIPASWWIGSQMRDADTDTRNTLRPFESVESE